MNSKNKLQEIKSSDEKVVNKKLLKDLYKNEKRLQCKIDTRDKRIKTLKEEMKTLKVENKSLKLENENLEYYEVVALFDEGKVKSYQLNLSNGALVYFLEGEDPQKSQGHRYSVPSVSLFIEDIHSGVIEYNRAHPDEKIEAKYIAGSSNSLLVSILPSLILFGLMGAMLLSIFFVPKYYN